MAATPNNLSKFWQELKRRNVVRVITVYTGAAFVILSLVDMIREPFELPNWSFKLVIVILTVGLIIAVILSWIYDFHPEGGMVKTEPADKTTPEEHLRTSKGWKIASYVSFVVILGLIVLNIVSPTSKKEFFDKSVAVIPFFNESADLDNSYLIKGYRTEVHNNLCQIKELRVISLESTEQYLNQSISISEIAKDLGVGYLLSARGIILNNKIRLTVQLANASDEITWSKSYDRKTNLVEDHIQIQSEIAQLVAKEIKVIVTPEVRGHIEKVRTKDLTSFDFYQRGNEELENERWNPRALDKAKEHFNKALSYDSTYGQAYLGLATVSWRQNISTEYLSEDYQDSALILVNKALAHDKSLADAYTLRGDYFSVKGYFEQAQKEYDTALSIKPNSWETYWSKYEMYSNIDQVAAIENLHMAIKLNRGSLIPISWVYFGRELAKAGIIEIGRAFLQKGYELNNSIKITRYFADIEALAGNWEEAVRLYKEYRLENHSDPIRLYELGCYCGFLEQHKESQAYLEQWLASLDETLYHDNQYSGMHRLGYAYWRNNQFDDAKQYFDLQMEYCNRILELDLPDFDHHAAYYDKAAIYAFIGETDKALENLKLFNQQKVILSWWYQLIKIDPLFDSLQDEPEFQQIVRDVEVKYQAEHKRVMNWLQENDML
jgi:TolB-like protein